MADVHAHLRFLRMSPRKVRLVVDSVRGLDVAQAERQLQFSTKAAALPVLKLIKSAVANAQHNNKLDPAHLYIKTITADGGPTLKRFRPRAMGSAASILKRTTHITVILGDRTPAKPAAKVAPKAAEKAEAKDEAAVKVPATAKKPAVKKAPAKKTATPSAKKGKA